MKNLAIIYAIIMMGFPLILLSQSITTTQHNLSFNSTGGGVISNTETEICLFCHTPHNARTNYPLWNRNDPSGFTYTLYGSSTLDAVPGQPDGASILCLSCHDGTIALGNVISRPTTIDFTPVTTMPVGNTNLTTDLSDDHVISFVYNAALAVTDGQLKDPSAITAPVALENTKVQCIACHDPHANLYSDFLVTTSQNSDLCMSCHDRTYWTASTHKSSVASWNSSGTDPWQHTTYTTVATNACENCHNPHNAGGNKRLLNYAAEENNCVYCHNTNVAATDIVTELAKTYTHSVSSYSWPNHDPTEPAVVAVQHVECVDCHNPHASNATTASAPNVNGFLLGVRGVNSAGSGVDPSSYAYEICYRCHADSPWKPVSSINRQITQNNTRLEFDPGNPSYHPVEAAGTNTSAANMPSLIAPLTTASIIYCTDCHASNGVGVPSGPHGSIYTPILKFNYETADNTVESYAAYELCYQCHDQASIMGDDSFNKHKKHLNDDVPCSACHDAHGISSTQGNATNNVHLINFNTDIVSPQGGVLEFIDGPGALEGECTLNCHGKKHDPKSY